MDIDAYVEAGLYDPTAPNADERLELLEWLEAEGLFEDDLGSLDIDDLVGSMAQRMVRPGRRLTVDEARARSGLSDAEFEAVRQAGGVPVDIGFTDADVDVFASYHNVSDLFSADELLNFVRVVSTSLSRVTDAAVSLFSVDVEGPVVASGGTELELAKQQLEGIALFEGTMPLIDSLMRMQMEMSAVRARQSSEAGQTVMQMGIGFVDLVGYTTQSLDLDSTELGRLLHDFERTAHTTVTEGGGRIVKLIGDEVMFVAVEASALCGITRSLVDAFTDQGVVTPRGGLAYGGLLSISGDYFGPIVNTASRIADLAVPNEVLVTEQLASAAPDFSFAPAGNRMLKGFPDAVPVLALDLD